MKIFCHKTDKKTFLSTRGLEVGDKVIFYCAGKSANKAFEGTTGIIIRIDNSQNLYVSVLSVPNTISNTYVHSNLDFCLNPHTWKCEKISKEWDLEYNK